MDREKEIVYVRLDEIIPNRFQPRLEFNDKELNDLAESIKLHGIIQPLVLRRIGDKYEIIAGERRYKAAAKAGLQTVPAIIMNMNDQQSAEVAVVENLQRKNLNAMEEAQSYKKILDMGYITQEELAKRMGVSQPTIANKLRLLSLTIQVKEALLKSQISERHARSLLLLTDANMQINMLNRIISERLTVRQTDEEIAKLIGKVPETPVVKTSVVPQKDNYQQQIAETKAFDVDTEKIKTQAENIIPEHKPSDIDMLLRTESQEKNENDKPKENNVSLEDETTNLDMGDIVSTNKMSINPFEETTETLDFDIPSKELEKPNYNDNFESTSNSLIEEFRQQQEIENKSTMPIAQENEIKSISTAINSARSEVKKIENLGFDVETEEFDFEDMYQIIIKIKKD